MTIRDVILKPVVIEKLPTQITLGIREVTEKRRQWRKQVATSGVIRTAMVKPGQIALGRSVTEKRERIAAP